MAGQAVRWYIQYLPLISLRSIFPSLSYRSSFCYHGERKVKLQRSESWGHLSLCSRAVSHSRGPAKLRDDSSEDNVYCFLGARRIFFDVVAGILGLEVESGKTSSSTLTLS